MFISKDAAGLLVSATDDYFLTNASWKCTSRNVPGWMQPTFDDSQWPAAVSAGLNNGSNPKLLQSSMSPNASWIWTVNKSPPRIDTTVFCRIIIRKWPKCV
jgi:hypothetical protein